MRVAGQGMLRVVAARGGSGAATAGAGAAPRSWMSSSLRRGFSSSSITSSSSRSSGGSSIGAAGAAVAWQSKSVRALGWMRGRVVAGAGAAAAAAAVVGSRRSLSAEAGVTAAAAAASGFVDGAPGSPAIMLYQYEVCPYCCIAKAYMDYHNIPYVPIETNPISKKEVKQDAILLEVTGQADKEDKSKKFSSVPIAIFREQTEPSAANVPCKDGKNRMVPVKGSMDILRHCEDLGLATTEWSAEVQEDVDWAFKKFIILFPPNIYRNMEEALEAFAYISKTDHFSTMERLGVHWGGAVLMWAVARFKLRKKYNITDERASLYEGGREWAKRVGDQAFRGGDKPNVADIAVYGMLSAMRDMTTLADLRKNVPALDAWYNRMVEAVGVSSRVVTAPAQAAVGAE